jgi:hypothetical protein
VELIKVEEYEERIAAYGYTEGYGRGWEGFAISNHLEKVVHRVVYKRKGRIAGVGGAFGGRMGGELASGGEEARLEG